MFDTIPICIPPSRGCDKTVHKHYACLETRRVTGPVAAGDCEQLSDLKTCLCPVMVGHGKPTWFQILTYTWRRCRVTSDLYYPTDVLPPDNRGRSVHDRHRSCTIMRRWKCACVIVKHEACVTRPIVACIVDTPVHPCWRFDHIRWPVSGRLGLSNPSYSFICHGPMINKGSVSRSL